MADPKRLSNWVFAGLFGISILLFSRILLPLILPVLLGGFLAVLFIPAHDWFRRRVPARPRLAAAASTSSVVLLVLVPLGLVAYLLLRELSSVMAAAGELLGRGELQAQLLASLPRGLRERIAVDPRGLELERAALSAVAGSAGVLTQMLQVTTGLLLDLFLMIVSMYYFFLDGRRLVAEGSRLVPLEPRYLEAFAKEFKDVAFAIVYGNSLTAVVQGVVGFLGLYLAGVPHAAIWAAVMAAFALIPVGGTAIVWGPIGIALLVGHHYPQGLFLLGWGALVVSTIDGVLRPRLYGSRMALHPLLVFLSAFGGIAAFGVMGILVGPLIASIFMAMVRIYRRDFLAARFPGFTAAPREK